MKTEEEIKKNLTTAIKTERQYMTAENRLKLSERIKVLKWVLLDSKSDLHNIYD